MGNNDNNYNSTNMVKINVVKRNGEKEQLDYEKINNVLLWSCESVSNVNASDVAMNAKLQIYDGITTNEIHQVLIRSAADMISEETPNYQYVASNLLNFYIRKNIFEVQDNLPHIKDVITKNIERGVYDKELLDMYNDEELEKINKIIKHTRDYSFTYAGLQQLIDKYLIRDRISNDLYETPQYMYILIAMVLFQKYDVSERFNMIRAFYNDTSTFKISLPTPIMSGVRTPTRQYSSCVLIDIDDTLDSIYNSNTAIGIYTARRAGIGINSRIRAVGDSIRNGDVVHTGVVPFFKVFEATVRSCTQNATRGGSATLHYPFWHLEVEDILVLKNNKGLPDNRVRKLDYSIQLCRLFYKRFVENKNITLFSPGDVTPLYDAFGVDNDLFEKLYVEYESNPQIRKKTISARNLMNIIVQERISTGRIYIMNIDNANTYSPFLDKISMSNLCQEINLVTSPVQHGDDGKIVERFIKVKKDKVDELNTFIELNGGLEYYVKYNRLSKQVSEYAEIAEVMLQGDDEHVYYREKMELVFGDKPSEIATCILSALNLGMIKELSELEGIIRNTLYGLDAVISLQDYPIAAAMKMLKRRSVGIGVTNMAYYLAKNNTTYDDPRALELIDELFEHIQYYAIKASVELAKKYGKCDYFGRTKYSQGIMPIDRYNKEVDKLVKRTNTLDWDALRADVLKYGMRNSTLTAIMPCESSSLVTNSTNGIEPLRSLVTVKKSKKGTIRMIAPEANRLKNKYQLAFALKDNNGISNIHAVIQKWIDQGISANHYYDFAKNSKLSVSSVIMDLLNFYKMGGKQLYYANSNDNKTDSLEDMTKGSEHQNKTVSDTAELEVSQTMSQNNTVKSDEYLMVDGDCESGACSI